MAITKTISTVWKWVVAWMPLGALLLMAFVSAVILNKVVNCDADFTGLKKGKMMERVCIPHAPQLKPQPNLDSQVELVTLDQQPFAELRGRLTWSISVLFFALTIAVTFAVILRAIIDALVSFRLLPAILIVFVVAGVIAGRYLPSGHTFKFNDAFLNGTVFRVSPADDYVDAIEFMGPMVLVGLAIAVSLILLWINRLMDPKSKLSLAAKLSVLARQQKRVRLLLYVGALTLVAGTLQASALYAWAMSMLTQPANVTPYSSNLSDIPQVMGILNGAFYSIFLAGIFVPAIAQLRGQAYLFADLQMPNASPAERSKWLAEHEVGGTVPKQLISALAVFAPLLAGGPLIALLEMVGG
ncbi:MAG TPA: hypothetical protein VF703_16500 [Pyrinomonadaceae bacterium]|jgi:hypothetical protein